MNKKSFLFQEASYEEIRNIMIGALDYAGTFEYKLLNGGLFNTTYLVECEDAVRYVLRLGPVNRQLLFDFEQNLMNAECYVYSLCRQNGIPCSEVTCCDTSKKIIDRDFMIVKYIDSVSLCGAEITEKEKSEIYREVGRNAKVLHSIKSEYFGRVSEVLQGIKFDSWAEYLLFEVRSILNKGKDAQLWDEAYQKRIEQFFFDNYVILDKVKDAFLIHTDLWEGNVLVKDGKCAAIIDPDRAIFGDLEMEFASPWMINEDFLSGYGEVNNSPDWRKKQMIYQVFFDLIDAYVWKCEYNQPQRTKELLDEIESILNKFQKIVDKC